jgi:hypothetical protein
LASLQQILPLFRNANLPVNSATEVAEVITGLQCEIEMNRKVILVEGSKSWDIEEGLLRTMPEWIGDGPMDTLNSLRGYLAAETASTVE